MSRRRLMGRMSGCLIGRSLFTRLMSLEFRKVRWVLRSVPGLVKRILLTPSVVTGTPMRLAKLLVMLPCDV